MEPERIEAIRRSDVNISRHDILARVNTRKEGTHLEENALNMKLLRWRLENNCIAWGKNSSSKAIEAYIYSTLFPEQIAKNTTEGGNPVRKSLGEVDYMRAIDWGTAPKKAKKKTMTKEKAEKRLKDRDFLFEKAAEWAKRLVEREASLLNDLPPKEPVLDLSTPEAIITYRLASLNHEDNSGNCTMKSQISLPNAQPVQGTGSGWLLQFLLGIPPPIAEYDSDPYKLLSTQPVSKMHQILNECLIEPTTVMFTDIVEFYEEPFGGYPEYAVDQLSYQEQVKLYQDTLDTTWAMAGRRGYALELVRLTKHDHRSMRWNVRQPPRLDNIVDALEHSQKTTCSMPQGLIGEEFTSRVEAKGEEARRAEEGLEEVSVEGSDEKSEGA